MEALVGRIAAPQALYQHGRRRYLPIEMFLSLFLLYFQGESGPKNALHHRSTVAEKNKYDHE